LSKYAVFIDGGYLSEITKQPNCPKIDFLKLSDELHQNAERLRTYYYTCMPLQGSPPTKAESERYGKADSFIHQLRKLPRFEVKLGRLQPKKTKNGFEFVQKEVDIMLGVDLVKMSINKQFDTAVVITGDSDFVYAVQAAKDAGVNTKLCYSKLLRVNRSLLDVFDENIIIDQNLLNKCKFVPY